MKQKIKYRPVPSTAVRGKMIAPCGINCALCSGYHRNDRTCPGCRGLNPEKPEYCRTCIVRTCPGILNSKSGFCYECSTFPCKRLKNLDKRYRQKYGASNIRNLEGIFKHGKQRFYAAEKEKWTCPGCGNLLCMHRDDCCICRTKNPWKGVYHETQD